MYNEDLEVRVSWSSSELHPLAVILIDSISLWSHECAVVYIKLELWDGFLLKRFQHLRRLPHWTFKPLDLDLLFLVPKFNVLL